MSNLNEDLLKQLNKLKNEYISDLPNKVSDIEKLLADYVNNGFDSETFHTFHRNCHSIAGTSSVHKLTEVSQAARDIELFIQPLVETDSPLNSAEIDNITELVAGLRLAIESLLVES